MEERKIGISKSMGKKGFKDLNERHKWNNRFIYKPIDYQKPIDVFVKELERRKKGI